MFGERFHVAGHGLDNPKVVFAAGILRPAAHFAEQLVRGLVKQRAGVLLIAGKEVGGFRIVGIISQRFRNLRFSGLQRHYILRLIAKINHLVRFVRRIGRCGGRFCKPALHLPRRGIVTEKHLPPDLIEQFQLRRQPGTFRETVVGDDGVMFGFDMPAVVNVAVQTIVFGRVDPVAVIKPHAVLVLRNLIGREPAEFVAPHLARLQPPRGFRRDPTAVVQLLTENRAAGFVIGIFSHDFAH